MSKEAAQRHANEQAVIDQVNTCMAAHPRFQEVTRETSYISYNMLDYIFKTIRDCVEGQKKVITVNNHKSKTT